VRVTELRGWKSLKALNSFHTLMLGLKMLPSYYLEEYEAFFKRVSEMGEREQEKLIREATLLVPLGKDEVESLVCFVLDPNGVPYSPENMKNLGPGELVEMIVAVSKEIAKVKINLVTDDEKKN
jgi:hypothetical protein